MPEASLPFHRAMPSLTHMALVELERAGILKFIISQVLLIYFSCPEYVSLFQFFILLFYPIDYTDILHAIIEIIE